ncbi:MAB_1171c family putative transporter [Mycobacterium sp. NPDC050853]|uniref:MAB_1171c family putative transporter n=1 Tax=Mycobacterium sp. NPDC050853 TaxID=3155160 RepID=UPI0033CBCA78
MTSSIPGFISWPVLTLFALVLAFRLRWLGTGLAARHRNRALIFVAATQVFTEPGVQHLLAAAIPCPPTTMSQIPFALLLLISPELIGFIAMIDNTDPAALARGYHQYRIATFITIAILGVIATGPRVRHQPIALAGDNSEVLAALVWSVLSVTAAAMILRLLATRFRRPNKTVAERLIVVELIGLAGAICLPGLAIFTLVLLERLQLAHTLQVRQTFYSHAIFVALLAVLPLALGPCFVAAQALLHRDTNGHTWRKLQPLWTDLTAAYPDTVLNEPPQQLQPVTDFQLHRVIIEIRDALLQLAPHITELTPTDRQQLVHACPPRIDVNQSALHALQIAKAIAQPDTANLAPASSAPLSATATREDELTQLIDLAIWWPTVKHVAEEQSQINHPVTLSP